MYSPRAQPGGYTYNCTRLQWTTDLKKLLSTKNGVRQIREIDMWQSNIDA